MDFSCAEGDEIQLETHGGIIPYKVDQLTIVTPEDVNVLGKRHADSLTLVTYYPFYFAGRCPAEVDCPRSSSGKNAEPEMNVDRLIGKKCTARRKEKHTCP